MQKESMFAHNPKVVGSSPTPATIKTKDTYRVSFVFISYDGKTRTYDKRLQIARQFGRKGPVDLFVAIAIPSVLPPQPQGSYISVRSYFIINAIFSLTLFSDFFELFN